MKRIYLIIGWWIGVLAFPDAPSHARFAMSLYGRNTIGEHLLESRSPTRQPGRSSSPMQRAQNIPESERPQQASTKKDRRAGTTPENTASRSTISTPQNPSRETGNTRSRSPSSTTPSPAARPNPPQHRTVVRGTVIGPASIDMTLADGSTHQEYIHPGEGQFVSASGSERHRIGVQTFSQGVLRSGYATLSAQGESSAAVMVKTDRGGGGSIQQKMPLPEWERAVPPDHTDSKRIVADPPPQHQFLMASVHGDGKAAAGARSPHQQSR